MRPSSPGSSGNIHRVGWVIENANLPPGRSTRAVSPTARSRSLMNCSAPNDENTTSNEPSVNGRCVAVPRTDGTAMPVCSSIRRECWSCRMERSRP